MRIARLFTGDDGQAHWDEIEIELVRPDGKLTAFGPEEAAVGVQFAAVPPQATGPWHNAPRRQYLVVLEGTLTLEIGDGTIRAFGPGTAFLVDDLTGQGHRQPATTESCTVLIAPLSPAAPGDGRDPDR